MDRSAEGVGSVSRFAFYVEHVASRFGARGSAGSLFRSYCTGLYSCRRAQNVSRLQPASSLSRPGGRINPLHHFVANADWSQEALLRRVRTFVLPAIEKSGRIRPGSSTTRGSRRRAFIRSESPAGHADNSASRTIVRLRSHCRQPTSTQACRSPFGSTFPKIGQSIRFRRGQSRRARGRRLQDQTANRARPDPRRPRRGCARRVVLADAGYGISTAFERR